MTELAEELRERIAALSADNEQLRKVLRQNRYFIEQHCRSSLGSFVDSEVSAIDAALAPLPDDTRAA